MGILDIRTAPTYAKTSFIYGACLIAKNISEHSDLTKKVTLLSKIFDSKSEKVGLIASRR